MTTIENQISEIAAKQKADAWMARQEAASRQKQDIERQRAERYRTNRIAQIKAELHGIPARRKQFESHAADATALCDILLNNVDALANEYKNRVHALLTDVRP